MATLKPAAEKRGPRIGDAASLWNFTPAPGWTKEEAQILKLCLMKHGVGRWIQILETGLLPGKLIQQLNGQTQRLLGQQSLAAYTGLQVDIDRIRADNDKLVDAERKNGLVINSGPNLTKQQKLQLQEEAKAKYGLSEAELKEVEEQLQELLAAKGQGAAGGSGQQGALPEAKAAAAGGVRGRAQREAELLARDTAGLSRDQKINFLLHLHEKLHQAAGRLAKALTQQPPLAAAAAGAAAAGAAVPLPLPAAAAALPQQPPPAVQLPAATAGSAENEGSVANAAPMQLDAPAAAEAHLAAAAAAKPAAPRGAAVAGKAAGGAAAVAVGGGGKRKSVGSGRQAAVRRVDSSDDEDEDGDWRPQPRVVGSSRGRRGAAAIAAAIAAAAAAVGVQPQPMDLDRPACAPSAGGGGSGRAAAAAAAAAADVEQLVAMGFSAKQARDALEESSYDVEAAIEWLVANCV